MFLVPISYVLIAPITVVSWEAKHAPIVAGLHRAVFRTLRLAEILVILRIRFAHRRLVSKL
jgi:hypothetical protein